MSDRLKAAETDSSNLFMLLLNFDALELRQVVEMKLPRAKMPQEPKTSKMRGKWVQSPAGPERIMWCKAFPVKVQT